MDYSNILIPLDGSEDAKHACRVAADLTKAIPGKETLHLLHCVEPIPHLIGGEQRLHIQREHEEKSNCIFSEARALLEETGNNFRTYIRYGDIAPTIVETAEELGCAMIIMGTHGMSDLKSLVLGGVSHEVLQRASVPVLLININRAPAERKE